MENKHKLMGSESITKLLLKFSVPAMIGMIVNALYNVIDRIYIGRIPNTGHYDIAGIGLVMPMMTIAFAFSLMIGMGSSTLISLSLGEKKRETAEKYLGNSVVYGTLTGIVLGVVTLLFLTQIVTFLGASENTIKSTKDYLSIIALGYPALIIGYVANASIRADGNPKIAMFTLLIGAILNIILDPIFIFYFGLGVKGAAIATIISQIASALWAVSYFISKKSTMKLKKRNLTLNFELVKKITILGVAPFALQVASGFTMFTLNKVLKSVGGDLAISGMTVVQSIMMFFTMPMFGINQAVLPIAGYNYGARLYSRVREVLKKSIFAAISIGSFGFLMILLFSKYFVFMFTKEPKVVELASQGLKIYTIMFPLVGFQIVSSIYFQAIGKSKVTLFLTLSRQVLFLIPSVLIFGNLFGVLGVWIAGPVADIFSISVTYIMIRKEMKQLKSLKDEPIEEVEENIVTE